MLQYAHYMTGEILLLTKFMSFVIVYDNILAWLMQFLYTLLIVSYIKQDCDCLSHL